ncbi:unnamed protein product [Symbiodinium natans]|uniref:Protein kinase domain-containing protein n=1 Tax=Symbiodinium natans TaxID=878477 RepID=A0A812L3A0_9DINO|nr:unnamed protein product [Symbiodinium natans]
MGAKVTSTQKVQGDAGQPHAEFDLGPLPPQPDVALTSTLSCEVLNTTKGLLRGCWGKFTADAFYRHFPGVDAMKTIRHIILHVFDITKYAVREGEEIEDVELLGEGSFSKVYGLGAIAAKVISDSERPWVHRAAVQNGLLADRHGYGPAIFGHGRVQQDMGGHFRGTLVFMERLYPAGEDWSDADTDDILKAVQLVAKDAFHNDLKMPNILRRRGRPLLIDFDLLSPWSVKVAVTSSCIEHDFQPVLAPAGERCTQCFREYYDLFAFTLTLQDSALYRHLLDRLLVLWRQLEEPVLRPLLATIGVEKLSEMPFEVFSYCSLQRPFTSLCRLGPAGCCFSPCRSDLFIPPPFFSTF